MISKGIVGGLQMQSGNNNDPSQNALEADFRAQELRMH